MNTRKLFVCISLSTAFLFFLFVSCSNNGPAIIKTDNNGSIYHRVLKDSIIRCGYTIYPPGCMRDSSGKLVGVFVETLEKAAQLLSLKVEWVEEVGWATQIEGLEKNRYDMIGSSVWSNSKRAKLATLTVPLYFSPIGIYIKSEDSRFDSITNWSSLNNSKYKVSVVDGGTGDVIRKSEFPLTTAVSLPENTDFGTSFLDVINRKADFLFMEPYQANKFLQNNDYQLKNIAERKPLHVYGNCYMFKRNQPEFEHMINTVLMDLINNGFVDRLVDKYQMHPGTFLKTRKDYSFTNEPI